VVINVRFFILSCLIPSFGEQRSSEHVTEQWVRSAIPLYLGDTGLSFDVDRTSMSGLRFFVVSLTASWEIALILH
jgi:hypothetical protein